MESKEGDSESPVPQIQEDQAPVSIPRDAEIDGGFVEPLEEPEFNARKHRAETASKLAFAFLITFGSRVHPL